MANPYLTTCAEDENGDIYFEIPDEILDATGWSEGTELSIETVDGAIIMREAVREM